MCNKIEASLVYFDVIDVACLDVIIGIHVP